jgi:hypothetical protein
MKTAPISIENLNSIFGIVGDFVWEEPEYTVESIGGFIDGVNPMEVDEYRLKMIETVKKQYASGERVPRRLTEAERKMHSERMKKDNPLTKDPSKTRTAKPVDVYYTDGRVESYAYAKLIPDVPYDTVKYMLKNNKGSKKHGIIKIEQKEK